MRNSVLVGLILAALTASASAATADLSLAKVVSNSTPNVGNTVTFTITLSNNGPNDATNVTVTDLLPAGLTFVAATPSQGTYNNTTGLWTVGTVSNAAGQTLQVTATVVSPSTQTNTASISHSDQFDPNPANNGASANETPQQANLSLTKIVSNPTPNVGDTVTFTITLSNAGPDAATNVIVSDLLPAGLTLVAATPSQGTYSNTTGLWTVGTVSSAASQTLQVTATVVSPSAQTNTASISHSDQFDPDLSNNTASATETPQQADLSLTKTVDNAYPSVGSTVTFTITLHNAGPNAATNVAVTDVLPAFLTFVNATPSQGAYITVSGAWTVGTVASGGSATLTISATMASGTTTNTASISHSDQFDPSTSNNSASATVSTQTADLSLTNAVNNPIPNLGQPVTFTITLSNAGPDTATSAVVTDLLPAGLSFISATPSQGTYNNGSGAWTVGNVSNVSSATLTVNATVAIPGVKTNTATVTHLDQKDPIPSNNSAAVTITPQILSLTSGPTATPSIGGIGQNIQFSAAASLAGTTFGWNFGDASTDTSGNANVSHAFSSAGTFTVTVTATNGTQRVTGTVTVSINGTAFGSGADSNGDGFSDAFDTAFGLNPTDPTQSPVPAGTTAGTLTAAKMSIKLNFAKQASDRLSLSGTLPIPARFNVNSAKIGLSAGDLVEVFTLSSKGKAKSGSNSASVSIKSTKGKVAAQTAKYAIKLNKDNLAADLLASGLVNDNATNKAVTISVGVVLSLANRSEGIVEEGTVPLHYTARKGKTGAAK